MCGLGTSYLLAADKPQGLGRGRLGCISRAGRRSPGLDVADLANVLPAGPRTTSCYSRATRLQTMNTAKRGANHPDLRPGPKNPTPSLAEQCRDSRHHTSGQTTLGQVTFRCISTGCIRARVFQALMWNHVGCREQRLIDTRRASSTNFSVVLMAMTMAMARKRRPRRRSCHIGGLAKTCCVAATGATHSSAGFLRPSL